MENASFDDFLKIEIRSGTIVKVEEFPKARKPAYKVWANFGDELGIRQTSAQITVNYTLDELPGRKIMGVVNIGSRNIGGFESQFLLVGFEDDKGAISLASFQGDVVNGQRLH